MGGLRHANFSLARGRTYGTAAAFFFCSEKAECSKVTEARVTAETGVMDVPDQRTSLPIGSFLSDPLEILSLCAERSKLPGSRNLNGCIMMLQRMLPSVFLTAGL